MFISRELDCVVLPRKRECQYIVALLRWTNKVAAGSFVIIGRQSRYLSIYLSIYPSVEQHFPGTR